jgi:hypothetical protein
MVAVKEQPRSDRYMGSEDDMVFVGFFWDSIYGGREETHVYKVTSGELIELPPAISKRPESPRFGWDVWYLPPGMYVVVDISRPNDRESPYFVKIDKLIVYGKEKDKIWTWRYWREPLVVEKVMKLDDVKYLIKKAKERCAECK